MNIKSAKYVTSDITNQNGSILVIFEDDTYASVPLKVGNRHYDAIQEQVDKGKITIEDAD